MEYGALGEYCTVTSAKRIFADQYVESGIPFYRSREIIEKNSYSAISEPLFIAPDVYESIKVKFGVPQEGDVLLTSVGTIGIPYVVGNEQFYFKDGNLTWMKDFSKELSPYYLYYWISSKFGRDSLANSCIGSSQAALTIEILKKYKLLIPDRHTQDGIVSILLSYDNMIRVNNKRIKVLEQMAENLYKEWFVRFRFPGYETTEFENGVPKEWHIKHIDEIGEVVGGGTPSTEHPEYWDGDIPWLTPADLASFEDVFISNGSTFITAEGMKKSSTKLLPKDTVLLSSRAPIGYVAIAKNAICTNQGFKSVICDTNIVMPFYLFFFFKNNKELLESYASGSTFLELSGGRLKKIKLIIPPLGIQTTFYNTVYSWLEQTDVLSQMNRNLIRQRDLLLPRLMSGKLEV